MKHQRNSNIDVGDKTQHSESGNPASLSKLHGLQLLQHSAMGCRVHIVRIHSCSSSERERENYAEKGGNPFLHMLRERALT